ncbi:MAG: outer membrane lipoprotein-sorting protein [Pseudomonadota bacterium]
MRTLRQSLCAALLGVFALSGAAADEPVSPGGLTGEDIAEKVDGREGGDQVRQDLIMTLLDSSGAQRQRRTVYLAKDFDETSKSVIFFNSPTKLKGTAFLTNDYTEVDKDDDQWLYLPATGRSRRISSSNRGGYFLGTDFTYEDIKKQTKLSLDDFNFVYDGVETIDGIELLVIEGEPVSEEAADELGYGKVRVAVDEVTWLAIKADYWDTNLNKLKTIRLYDIAEVQGIITAHRIIAENHKTGHKTEFLFENVDYNTAVAEDVFTEAAMRQGLD